jgi:predicted membrane protein
MSKSYTEYLLEPLALSIYSIVIYFIPFLAVAEKWIIAIIYIFIVWIGSLYRYVSINNRFNSYHPGSKISNIQKYD